MPELHLDEAELEISSVQEDRDMGPAIVIRHIPTGTVVQCSGQTFYLDVDFDPYINYQDKSNIFICFYDAGERSQFANKMKALNRLKAKLLVVSKAAEPRSPNSLTKSEARRKYVIRPHRLVNDVKTGLRLPDLNSVLDGNIEPLIRAHIRSRYPEFWRHHKPQNLRLSLSNNARCHLLHVLRSSSPLYYWFYYKKFREREMSWTWGGWKRNAEKMSEEVKKRAPGHTPGEVLQQRGRLPYSPLTMAAVGIVIVGAIGYAVLYGKSRPGSTPSEVAKVTAGSSNADVPHRPNK